MALQQTIVVPIVPEVPRLLDVSPSLASWLITSCLLAGAVATPVVAQLADLYGKHRMLLACLTMTVIGSVVAAVSDGIVTLVVARCLQGLGLALIPIGISIMRDTLDPHQLPIGVGLMSASMAAGASAGPPLAGYFLGSARWQDVFWLTAALGAALLVAAMAVPRSTGRHPGRLDAVGGVLLGVALAALLVLLSDGASWGWGSSRTLAAAAVGLVAFFAWLPWELRVASPLIDLRSTVRPDVLVLQITSLLLGIVMLGNLLTTSHLLLSPPGSGVGAGLHPVDAGLWLIPSAIAFGIAAPFAALAARRWGAARVLLVSTMLVAVTYFGRSLATEGLTAVVVGSVLVSVATSVAYASLPTALMEVVPTEQTTAAQGLNALLRSIGTGLASAGIAAAISAQTTRVNGHEVPSAAAFDWILRSSAVAATIGVVLLIIAPIVARNRPLVSRPR